MRGHSRARGHARSAVRRGGQPFSPKSLPSLAGWWRADQGITLNGSTVSQWNDLSGNARHLTQGTAANQPLFVASGIGGQAAVEFVSTDYLDCAAATWGAAVSQPNTVYVVAYTSQDTQRDIFDNVSGAGDRQILGTTTSPSPQPFMYAGTSLLAPTQAMTSAIVIGYTANSTSSTIYIGDSQTAKVTGDAGTLGMGSLRLGASQGATVPQVGRTAEVIVYSGAHSAATRLQVFRYLGARYSLTVS